MKSRTLVLPIIVMTIRALVVCPAVGAELHNWFACPWNSGSCSGNCLLDPGRCLGLEQLVWFQVRLDWTVTTMTSTYTLQHIIMYYCVLLL